MKQRPQHRPQISKNITKLINISKLPADQTELAKSQLEALLAEDPELLLIMKSNFTQEYATILTKIKTNHGSLLEKFSNVSSQKIELTRKDSDECLDVLKKLKPSTTPFRKLKPGEEKEAVEATQLLSAALLNNEFKKIPALVKRGADINRILLSIPEKSIESMPILHFAISSENQKLFDTILQFDNLNVNIKYFGQTPLMVTIIEHRPEYFFNGILAHPKCDVNATTVEGATALDLAIQETNNTYIVKSLCEAGTILNRFNLQNQTPLIKAIGRQKWEMVDVLLDPKYKAEVTLTKDASPLIYLMLNKQFKLALKLMRHPSMKLTVFNGITELDFAIQEGVISLLKTFKELNMLDCNAVNAKGRTPLIDAIHGEKIESVIFLLKQPDINLNCIDEDNLTPLLRSVVFDQLEIFELLRKTPGVDLTAANSEGRMAVHLAASNSPRILKRILEEKPELITARSKTHLTPLHCAAIFNQLAAVQWLIEKFPDCINDIDCFGHTVLHNAVRYRKWEVVEFLVSFKPELLGKKTFGNATAFELAIAADDLECFKALLSSPKKEVNSIIQSIFDSRPLAHYAVKCKAKNILEYLLISQTRSEKSNKDLPQVPQIDIDDVSWGNTLLDSAAKAQDWSMGELLLNHGADPLLENEEGLTVEEISDAYLRREIKNNPHQSPKHFLKLPKIKTPIIISQEYHSFFSAIIKPVRLQTPEIIADSSSATSLSEIKSQPKQQKAAKRVGKITSFSEYLASIRLEPVNSNEKQSSSSKIENFSPSFSDSQKERNSKYEVKNPLVETKQNFFPSVQSFSLSDKDKKYCALQNYFYLVENHSGKPRFIFIAPKLLKELEKAGTWDVIQKYLIKGMGFIGASKNGVKPLEDIPVYELCLRGYDFRILARQEFSATNIVLSDKPSVVMW